MIDPWQFLKIKNLKVEDFLTIVVFDLSEGKAKAVSQVV
jgi:hypothetical protein